MVNYAKDVLPGETIPDAAATSYGYYEEIDYNDIQALRAFAARVQGSKQDEEVYHQLHEETEQEEANPQDADWDPDQAS